MQKLLLSISTLLLASSLVQARGTDVQDQTTINPTVTNIFPHFNPTIGGQARVTGWQGSRLVAKAYSKHNGHAFINIDSTTYSYGGHRGSSPNMEDLNKDDHILFDKSYTYQYDPQLYIYKNQQFRSQSFNNDGNVQLLNYKVWSTVSNGWKNKEQYTYEYVNGKMKKSTLELWIGNLWQNYQESTIDYDTRDNIIKMKSISYSVDFNYDMNNNLMLVEDEVRDINTGVWSKSERKTYTYAGKQVKTYTLEKWDKSVNAWVKQTQTTYDYTLNNLVKSSTENRWNGSGWENSKRFYNNYDAKGNLTSTVMQQWYPATNQYINATKRTLKYNSFDQPTETITHTWLVNTWLHQSNDEHIRYYYQPYSTNSVNEFANNDQLLNVYPIPATNQLNVNTTLKDATAQLVDMSGRVVYQQTASNKSNISVQHLPAGNYTLVINAGHKKLTKQVVVAH